MHQNVANPPAHVSRARSCAVTIILVGVAVVIAAPTPSAAQDTRGGLSFNAGPVGGSAGGGGQVRISFHRITGQRAILARYGTTFVDSGNDGRVVKDVSVMIGYTPQPSRSGRLVASAGLAATWGQRTDRRRYPCQSVMLSNSCVSTSRSNIRIQPAVALQAGLYQAFTRRMGASFEATALVGKVGVLMGASIGLMFGPLR